MHIIESFIQGKYPSAPERCEDGWVVTADFAAVVDGSTSKRARALDGASQDAAAKTGGRMAMETAVGALRQMPADATMAEAAKRLTAALRPIVPREAAADTTFRPTCSAAVLSRQRREVWLFGDCQCRFNGETHTNGKLVDTILARIRGEAIHYLLEHGHSADDIRRHDRGRALIYDALREQTHFQNDPDKDNPFRYTVIDGQPMDIDTVPVLHIGAARRLVLATDGYPVLSDTLRETEARLKELLEADPLCIGPNAATKCLMEGQVSFDDRTFISISL